ncbi:MAG: hypothetical protein ABI369_15700 [Acetobacteraceae bacterium]
MAPKPSSVNWYPQRALRDGRDYDEIIKSSNVTGFLLDSGGAGAATYEEYAKATIVGTPEQVRERLQALVDVGVDYIIISIPRVAYDQEPLRQFVRDVILHFA